MNSPSIIWLRRDLRLHDHAALHKALQSSDPVQLVFVFDTDVLASFPHRDDRRLSFLARTLCHIHQQLKAKGGRLWVLHGSAQALIPQLAQATGAARVICAEDFEPATIARDAAVKAALTCPLVPVLDQLVHHPASITKADGEPYKVFTPYSKAWRAALKADSYDEKPVHLNGRLANVPMPEAMPLLDVDAGAEAMLAAIGYRLQAPDEWTVDDVPARLTRFIDARLGGYKNTRDVVGIEGTSKLSPYLRFGLVSVRECARLAAARPSTGSDGWINELIWREFYAMILFRFPEVVAHEFQPHYRGLAWRSDNALLEAWQQGKTGFPIVDAAMRELRDTGWMHNRARMIVASFFTKDLHLNWRQGEAHFGQLLMDYDLASNNGGWQWAASTGTDAQPYFRIFNPELQSRRFDPDAVYIKRHVPELRGLDADSIHALHKGASILKPADYPAPVVDHHAEKDAAIAMFKGAAA